MKRETITISVGPQMKKFILKQAAAEFDSVSQYIRKLVRADNYWQRQLARARNENAIGVSRELILRDREPPGRP